MITDAIGVVPFPAPPAAKPLSSSSPTVAPAKREELLSAVDAAFVAPSEQAYRDPLEQERDVLAVVNFALERRGIRGMAEFASWLDHVSLQANASGFRDISPKFAEPMLVHVAAYLRSLEADARRGLRV